MLGAANAQAGSLHHNADATRSNQNTPTPSSDPTVQESVLEDASSGFIDDTGDIEIGDMGILDRNTQCE